MSSSDSNETTVVITDTSCFIILEKIGLLDILHKLFSVVITTPEIAAEYKLGLPEWVIVIPVRDKKNQQSLSAIVDIGEASAIALAQEIENHFLITDDLEARKLSAKLGLAVIGTIGILIRAKQNGLVDLIKPFLDQMKQTNFRFSEELYNAALNKAGEK